MTNCIVCNNTSFQLIYSDTLKKCGNCGFVTANLEIREEELKQIYSENYFMGKEYLDYIAEKDSLQKNFRKRLRYILKHSGAMPISSVLELGCAYGYFAETINTKLNNIEFVGIDVVSEAIEYGKTNLNQNLILGNYLEYKGKNNYSDIFMWDVIEHLQNPELFLQKSYNELEKGGHIYITTGDIDRFIPRWKKDKWRLIHPPSHLHYFSAKTLSQLLQNYGFKTEFIKYPAIYRSVKQIYYSLFLLNKKPNRFKRFFYKLIPTKLKIPVNTFDIMFVKAIK